MEERSVEQIFPYQSIKAKIDQKIIIGRFKPSDMDKITGKVNLYKLRMEVQKFNKKVLEQGGILKANVVRGQMKEIRKRNGKQMYGITEEEKQYTGKEADVKIIEFFKKLYETKEERRKIKDRIGKEEFQEFIESAMQIEKRKRKAIGMDLMTNEMLKDLRIYRELKKEIKR